jgi:Matrixin
MIDLWVKRIVLPLTAALVAASLVAPGALAYHLYGGKMPTALGLRWQWGNGLGSADMTAFTNARTAWTETPTQICICTQVSDGSFHIEFMGVNNNSVNWDGISSIIPSPTSNPYMFAYAEMNKHFTDGYVAGARQSVAAHEIGHTLGLAHTNGAVLMNPYTLGTSGRWQAYGIKVPTQDEINGINYLY